MLILKSLQRSGFIAALLAGAATASQAHIIPISELQQGIFMTQAQCAALPSAVWVIVQSRPYCIRYYLSTAGGEGPRPVVFLQGDKLGSFNTKTGAFKPDPAKPEKDIDTDTLDKWAESMSKRNKTTGIYLARLGIDGSSGDHRHRHTLLELQVTNAALETIKQRHRFDGFHLVGQSGGSTLVGGLLAMRSDIGCAAIGAGVLVNPRSSWPHGPTGQKIEQFSAIDAVATIAQRRSTRIMVITDPADKKVIEAKQTPFVQMLQRAGGQVDHFIVQAIDENHHGVAAYALAATAACIKGAGTPEIALALAQLVEKRLADKAKADQQKNAQPAPPSGYQPPPPNYQPQIPARVQLNNQPIPAASKALSR